MKNYLYDASGRLEKTLREDDDAIYYEYDAVGRTTRETWKASDHSTIYAFAWDYDEVGNRTYEYLNTTGTATETYYTFNGLNRPLHKHNWPADTYTYYQYDSRNNITQVDEPAVSTYFYYDDHNKLIKTTYKSPYAGRYTTEYFGYDASGRRNFHLPWAYNEVYFTYDQNGEMLSKRMSSQNMARLNGQSVVAMFDWYPYFVVYDTLRRFAGVVRQGAYPYPSDIGRYCFNSAGRLFTYYFPYSIEMNTAVFPDSLYFVWGKLTDTGEVVLTDGTPGQGGEYPPMPPNSGHAGQCPETVLCCEALAPERPVITAEQKQRLIKQQELAEAKRRFGSVFTQGSPNSELTESELRDIRLGEMNRESANQHLDASREIFAPFYLRRPSREEAAFTNEQIQGILAAYSMTATARAIAQAVKGTTQVQVSRAAFKPSVPVKPIRVTQYFDPKKGAFPLEGEYALSSKPTLVNRCFDWINKETTWVAPRPATEMNQWRRFWTGVGDRRNFVEFDVMPSELKITPTKALFSGSQATIPGRVSLIGRNPVYGMSGFNYLDFGIRYVAPAAGGSYLLYREVSK